MIESFSLEKDFFYAMELSSSPLPYSEVVHLENCLRVLTAQTGVSNYDFSFNSFFDCRHDWKPLDKIVAIARIGAVSHYDLVYQSLQDEGITLLHNPDEYLRASELPHWYPLIEDLTPKSIWFSKPPSLADVVPHLNWPIFMKGTRQTSTHQRLLSIIESKDQFEQIISAYSKDPILRHQGIVCREFLQLRPVEDSIPSRIPSSFEFRTFWWRGQLAGLGRYWWDGKYYRMTKEEEVACVEVAAEAARRLNVPFLVIDLAQLLDGRWVVIECNDGQESGYAGISPIALWQKIIDIEHQFFGM